MALETVLKQEQDARARIAALEGKVAARLCAVQAKEEEAARRVEESNAQSIAKQKEMQLREVHFVTRH